MVKLRDQRGDRADGREERSQDGAVGSHSHGDLDKRVAVLIPDNDALDVALVDQVANLIDECARCSRRIYGGKRTISSS